MRNGIPNYNEIIFTKEQEEFIVKLYTIDKKSTVQIGNIMECSYNKINRIHQKYNIDRRGNYSRKYNLNTEYFDDINTKNKAYVLGLFCADGCNYPPKSTAYISLQENDRELLEKIRKEMDVEKELVVVDCSNRHDNGYSYNNMCVLNLYSSHICNSLNKLGVVQNKSLKLKFPNIQPCLYNHFLRGYFNGDGSIYLNNNNLPTVTLTSTQSFCMSAKAIIESCLNIYCGVYESSCHNGITKVLQISGKSAVKFLDWIYDEADLYLLRKYNRYIQYTKI